MRPCPTPRLATVLRPSGQGRADQMDCWRGRTTPPRRCARCWARSSRTSTPRATRATATTPAASRRTPSRLLAVERAKTLFGAEHANVQPYSGTSAILAAYAALLRPGDAVLAMSLAARRPPHPRIGGQLLRPLVRLHRVRRPRAGRPGGPGPGPRPGQGGTAEGDPGRGDLLPRALDWAAFRAIADEVGAYLVADAAQTIGLVAGGVLDSPVPYADVVCGVTHKLLGGPRGGLLLCTAELAERVDRAVFPFTQGGPAMNQIAAKALVLGLASTPAVRRLRPPGGRQRAGAGGGAGGGGAAAADRGHRHPPGHRRRPPAGADRDGRPSCAARRPACCWGGARSRSTRPRPPRPPASGSAPPA